MTPFLYRLRLVAPRLLLVVGMACLVGELGGDRLSALVPLGPAPTEPSVRLIRSSSGTKGIQQGSRFVIEDPRAVFSPLRDRQVVVHFEWDGRPGAHHCEGRWKDPTGKIVLVAPVEYHAASRRFGIYWTLAIPETVTRGLWALEAYVDGQPAGTHIFEINEAAAEAVAAPSRLPSTSEIYQKALAAVGTIERLGLDAGISGRGPAVAIGADHVVTAFETIETAATLRLITGEGRRFETQEIAARNRQQGWAVLRFPGHGLTALPRAKSGALEVGERCFVLDSEEDGSRVIAEASVVGRDQSGPKRLRLNSGHACGSPVLDEHGDIVGIIGESTSEGELGPLATILSSSIRFAHAAFVIPLDLVPDAAAGSATPLSALAASGEFTPPLSPERRHVISGVFAGKVERGGPVPMPLDQRFVFSRREGQISVFVELRPEEKRDTLSRFEIYDGDNRVIVRSDPVKLKLRQGQLLFSTWVTSIASLPAAVYRVDLLFDQARVWRGYVRVTE